MNAIRRETPAYIQIAEHFRKLIKDGELRPGDRLPGRQEIGKEFGVGSATVHNAVRQLIAEELAYVDDKRGTFVAGKVIHTAAERQAYSVRTGRVYPENVQAEVTAAGIAPMPARVAEVFNAAEGDDVIKRQRVERIGSDALRLAVSWMPAEYAAEAPQLLETEPITIGVVRLLENVSGRTATYWFDQISAMVADDDTAGLLGVAPGTAVLFITNLWRDDDGVIEYGEAVVPAGTKVSYSGTAGA